MIHYVTLAVSDLERSAEFYDALVGPLGWRRHSDGDRAIGWGLTKPTFFVEQNGNPPLPEFGEVAFPAKSIPACKAAWQNGVERGGVSRDEPGATPTRSSGTYCARLRDPDGYNLEISVVPE